MINFVGVFLRDLSFRVLGKSSCSSPLAQEPARLSRPHLVIKSFHVILNIRIVLISSLILKLAGAKPVKNAV